MPDNITDSLRHSSLERYLNIFAKVEPKEGITSLLLILNIFFILVAYYFIKPVREGWLSVSVVADWSKLEVKAYSAFGQSLLLLVVLPVYAIVAKLISRRQLITVTGITASCLMLLFWLMQPGILADRIPYSGVLFYIFVGIFSVTLVAQFWSFASDLYGLDRGKRLFPLIAVGASAGALVGSWSGERLIRLSWVSAFDLILYAIVPVLLSVALARKIDQRGTEGQPTDKTVERWNQPAAPEGEGSFQQIWNHRYLSATALLVLLFSWVVTSGDNILFGLVQEALVVELPANLAPAAYSDLLKESTTAFYSGLYFWVNLIGLFLQAFIVSRLVRLGGFTLLVIATPLISLTAYMSMAIAPVIGIIKAMKIAENSSIYSINNTARNMLWLPASKSMLYQAKTTVDTLFVRIGDGLAALTVLLGTRVLHLTVIQFLIINIFLVLVWLLLTFFISKEYRRWGEQYREKQEVPGY